MITLFGCAHFFNLVSFLLYPTEVNRLKCALLGSFNILDPCSQFENYWGRSSHSAQYCRYVQTYSDALKNSFFPQTIPHTGIVFLLLWSIPRPKRSLGHSSLVKNTAKFKVCCFFCCCCCFFSQKFQNSHWHVMFQMELASM